jgi:hypothetical protein
MEQVHAIASSLTGSPLSLNRRIVRLFLSVQLQSADRDLSHNKVLANYYLWVAELNPRLINRD